MANGWGAPLWCTICRRCCCCCRCRHYSASLSTWLSEAICVAICWCRCQTCMPHWLKIIHIIRHAYLALGALPWLCSDCQSVAQKIRMPLCRWMDGTPNRPQGQLLRCRAVRSTRTGSNSNSKSRRRRRRKKIPVIYAIYKFTIDLICKLFSVKYMRATEKAT